MGRAIRSNNSENVGNITADDFVATTITETSSIVLKENVEPLADALSKIISLNGVNYDRISSGTREAGLIAEEVEKIIPEVVDSCGEYKSVSYSRLTAYLIEAVKRLKQDLDELK